MTLEKGLEIIRKELLKQAERHRGSASKQLHKYAMNRKLPNIIDCIRLEVISESLEGLGKVLTVEKISQWHKDQLNKSG